SRAIRFAALAFALPLALAVGIAPPARAGTPAPQASPPAAIAATSEGTVNLNSATVEELVRLPGVGPAKAAAICSFRERHGAFKRIEDLDRVKGFGRKLIGRVRRYVALSGPTTSGGRRHSTKERPRAGEPVETK